MCGEAWPAPALPGHPQIWTNLQSQRALRPQPLVERKAHRSGEGVVCSFSWFQVSLVSSFGRRKKAALYIKQRGKLPPSSLLTVLSMDPPAGDNAELPFVLTPFQAPELAGQNLVIQILGGLEQGGFERVVSGFGVQGGAMNQQRGLPRKAGLASRSGSRTTSAAVIGVRLCRCLSCSSTWRRQVAWALKLR